MIRLVIEEYNQNIQKEIGERIREKRLEKDLTAADVGAYLDISANQVYRIESGKVKCNIAQLYVLAQLLDCSVDYFLFGEQSQWMLTEEQRAAVIQLLLAFESDKALKDAKNKESKS